MHGNALKQANALKTGQLVDILVGSSLNGFGNTTTMSKKDVQSIDWSTFCRLLNPMLYCKPRVDVLTSSEGIISRTNEDNAEMLATVFEQLFM